MLTVTLEILVLEGNIPEGEIIVFCLDGCHLLRLAVCWPWARLAVMKVTPCFPGKCDPDVRCACAVAQTDTAVPKIHCLLCDTFRKSK